MYLFRQGVKNVRFRLQMRSRVLEDEDVLEYEEGDSFLTVNVVPSLQGGKGGGSRAICGKCVGRSVFHVTLAALCRLWCPDPGNGEECGEVTEQRRLP